jgi:anti-sigma28 factor (negative regulator of flagellin synthesis)
MTSRRDGTRGTPLPAHVDRTEAGNGADGKHTQAKKPGGVEPCSEAGSTSSAHGAANDALSVRSAKVEAAKKALTDGTLDADAGTLADALIDHLLSDEK